jgi:transposase-like protein
VQLPPAIGEILKRFLYPLDVILLCVRWYVACSRSLREFEERWLSVELRRITRACTAG